MSKQKKPAMPATRMPVVVSRVITKYQHRATRRNRSRGDKRRTAINDSSGE